MADGTARNSSHTGSAGSAGEMATRGAGIQSPHCPNVVVGGFSPCTPHVREDIGRDGLIKLAKESSPSSEPNTP